MTAYFIEDIKNYYETVELIENEVKGSVSLIIKNDIGHCHRLRHLDNEEISMVGLNKPKYEINIDVEEISSNPSWRFNGTLFFYSGRDNINFSNLHFIHVLNYLYFVDFDYEYDEETDKYIELIELKNDFNFSAFNILLMEFSGSTMEFKDCTFENNTNKKFEIIANKKSHITFTNCVFDGAFIFSFDSNSKISIQ